LTRLLVVVFPHRDPAAVGDGRRWVPHARRAAAGALARHSRIRTCRKAWPTRERVSRSGLNRRSELLGWPLLAPVRFWCVPVPQPPVAAGRGDRLASVRGAVTKRLPPSRRQTSCPSLMRRRRSESGAATTSPRKSALPCWNTEAPMAGVGRVPCRAADRPLQRSPDRAQRPVEQVSRRFLPRPVRRMAG